MRQESSIVATEMSLYSHKAELVVPAAQPLLFKQTNAVKTS